MFHRLEKPLYILRTMTALWYITFGSALDMKAITLRQQWYVNTILYIINEGYIIYLMFYKVNRKHLLYLSCVRLLNIKHVSLYWMLALTKIRRKYTLRYEIIVTIINAFSLKFDQTVVTQSLWLVMFKTVSNKGRGTSEVLSFKLNWLSSMFLSLLFLLVSILHSTIPRLYSERFWLSKLSE